VVVLIITFATDPF